MSDTAVIRFYLSFRSPYAWFASERLERELGDLGVPIEAIPTLPTPELFPNDPSAIREKAAFLVQDVLRLARELGLTVRLASVPDCDWSLSHAAFLGSAQRDSGRQLLIEIFRKRFAEGQDLGHDNALAAAAELAGLDPAEVLEDAHNKVLRERASAGWARGVERDRIFGVPSFAFAGKLYLGQDRMHHLRSAVLRKLN